MYAKQQQQFAFKLTRTHTHKLAQNIFSGPLVQGIRQTSPSSPKQQKQKTKECDFLCSTTFAPFEESRKDTGLSLSLSLSVSVFQVYRSLYV